jgi:hypothetical protein
MMASGSKSMRSRAPSVIKPRDDGAFVLNDYIDEIKNEDEFRGW